MMRAATLPSIADGVPIGRLTDPLRQRFEVEDGWRFGMRRRVRFSEIDGLGHANNATYLTYFEDVRIAYFEGLGLPPFSAGTLSPVLARSAEQYIRPLGYGDEVLVTARVSRLGRTSFGMDYAVWRKGCAARGEVVAVMMIPERDEKVPLPDDLRAAIAALEERSFDPPAP
jgi:acyl-CoA thioester hydrolase